MDVKCSFAAKKHSREKHRKKSEESYPDHSETKGEKELRKKRKKKKKANEDLATTFINDLEDGKGELNLHELDANEVRKKSKKGKRRRAESKVEQTTSDNEASCESQRKKSRVDPSVTANNNIESKKKRKHESSFDISEEFLLKKTKHKSKNRKQRDREKCYQMLEGEDNCFNVGTQNEQSCLEMSTTVTSGDAHSLSVSSFPSRTKEERQLKKKKKRKEKEKDRNIKAQDLKKAEATNVSGDHVHVHVLDGNKVVSSRVETSQKDKEKCYQMCQDQGGSACNKGNRTGNLSSSFETSTSETPGYANSFSNRSLHSGTREERQHKKKDKEKERNETVNDLKMTEVKNVNVDRDLDRNNVLRSKTCKSSNKVTEDGKLQEAVRHANVIHETWTVSKKRLDELKEKGIKVRKGKWSSKELELLKSNMKTFLENHGLEDSNQILFRASMDKEDRRYWIRFAKQNEFYQQLGKGLQRPLDAIYKCALRIYDKTNYVGKYTDEEVKELRRLHALHGTDWVTIGQSMDRSRMSVNRKFSTLPPTGGGTQRGQWTDEELKRLKEAVHLVSNTAEGQPVPFNGIYWPAVAQMVKTRNTERCRRKWLEKLCWTDDVNEKQWTKHCELKLITRLYNSGITEECDVDWMEVKSEFKTNYSPHWLRNKWSKLKKKVPDYHQLDFEDIVDNLYRVYGKTLRDQLETESSTCETKSETAPG